MNMNTAGASEKLATIGTASRYRRLTVEVFRSASKSHTVLSLQKWRAWNTETNKHTTVLRLTEVERGFRV